ncbi:Protein CBG20285 [Caenorhabditis briggsae]|uniref:Protein CBG20285 n=1 Tax=Caenorhabditis briggsae TaxID=6238 RepID=A8XXG4_CAEBR|nr:Protein CBG20285 [Caenorhabditis briggsae]CAP37310.1 Protein CBG20285 [Caenorhabditis briggsae]
MFSKFQDAPRFKDAPRGVELVKAMIEGAATLPTELRGQRESGIPIAYIKARTTGFKKLGDVEEKRWYPCPKVPQRQLP